MTQHALHPDSKVHGAYRGPTWGRQDPGGPHVGPMNLAIRVIHPYRAYLMSHQQIRSHLYWWCHGNAFVMYIFNVTHGITVSFWMLLCVLQLQTYSNKRIPIIKATRSQNSLRLTLRTSLSGREGFYIETGPSSLKLKQVKCFLETYRDIFAIWRMRWQ